ncbi:hypothetical protein FAI40_08685 [Acetobacteraceae bacterium]|nr:hypothetical protein FAI40_08685 [Acetobacteraceae bacterium]
MTISNNFQAISALTLGAFFAALIRTGRLLKEEKIVIFGEMEKSQKISELISSLLQRQGLPQNETLQHIRLLKKEDFFETDFLKLLKDFHASTLIGISGGKNVFSENILKQMGQNSPSPIIFPLSTPLKEAEATAEDIYKATNGRAMICTGALFPPLAIKSTDMDENRPTTRDVLFSTLDPALIQPAISSALKVAKLKDASKKMLIAAAVMIAQKSPRNISKEKGILPDKKHFEEISGSIALAMAEEAVKEKRCPPLSQEALKIALEKEFHA